MVAHERLTEPRVTKELLLAKRRSLSNLPAFLDHSGIIPGVLVKSLLFFRLPGFPFGRDFSISAKPRDNEAAQFDGISKPKEISKII